MTATDDERRIQPGSNRESARGLSDEQIFCPFCHYNLTANESGRCPECGSFFDREILLRAAAEEARFVMPWDSPEEMPLLRRFWDTLRQIQLVKISAPKKYPHSRDFLCGRVYGHRIR